MLFSIVAVVSENNVIGKDNKLPWHIPEDLEHFYNLIRNKAVVMGHNTYNSIGHPIKDSKNIVLSRNDLLKIPGCLVLHSIQEVLDLYQDDSEEVMIIGGGSIYKQFLPYVKKMYLTLIHGGIEGDTYFPCDDDQGRWKLVSERESSSDLYSYSFVVLER